jgi:hypothetical protein
VNVTPWDVPEPEPTDPPSEKMFPFTTRLPEKYKLPWPELVLMFDDMMMLFA